jgi:release factor glutamine methyltransferase
MPTIKELIEWGAKELLNNSSTPKLDAEILLADLLKIENRLNLILHSDKEVSNEIEAFKVLIAARKNKVPVAYLTKRKEFFGEEFYVEEGVLVPRPETEHLVEQVINSLKNRKVATLLEIGVGSGCVVSSLGMYARTNNLQWKIHGVDISATALNIASKNITKLGLQALVKLKQSDLFSNIEGKYDCIISNPPYLSEAEFKANPDLEAEPKLALVAGEKGTEIIEKIISESRNYLLPCGFLLLEIGATQGVMVAEMGERVGFSEIKVIKDLAGNDRVVLMVNNQTSNKLDNK